MNFSNGRQKTRSAIQAIGLGKRYRTSKQPVLTEFNLNIDSGEFFGLLGPNGAGKTTILSMLSGVLRPDNGTIHIHGMTYTKDRRRIQRKIGIVPQEIAVYERLTARENLMFFGELQGLGGKDLRERVIRCLQIAQLEEKANQPVFSFSGGMKRRLNLVIALLNDPPIIFLDEPTVGIDAQSRHLIHQELKRLHGNGTTLLYTTHYMEEAQDLCSRIAVLDDGHVLLAGPPGELLRGRGHHNLEELFLALTGKQIRDD
jgi:ABC-2 type transport system ATP-binding protein